MPTADFTESEALVVRARVPTKVVIDRTRPKNLFLQFIRYPPSYSAFYFARARSSQTQPTSNAVYRPSFSLFFTIRSRDLKFGSLDRS